MEINLKGLHKVTKTLASGERVTYYFAWRGKGAPRLLSKPGTAAFVSEFERHTRNRRPRADKKTFATIIDAYMASPRYQQRSVETKRQYEPRIGLIRTKFGEMPLIALEATGVRRVFNEWHESMSDSPRSADIYMSILSRILSSAQRSGLIGKNPMEGGFERLHSGSRKDIIWPDAALDLMITNGRQWIVEPVLMALWTMQRQGDLLRMPSIAWDGERLAVTQQKGGARVWITPSPVIVPILERAKGRQRMLVNSHGQNWSSSGFQSSFPKELKRLGIKGLTFHDLRGTAITHAYRNLTGSHEDKIRTISHISGHSERSADAIISKHYLSGKAVTDAITRGMT